MNKNNEAEAEKIVGGMSLMDEAPRSARPIGKVSALSAPYSGTGDPKYADLRRILDLAYDQAAVGKGRDRHAMGPTGYRAWDRQPINEISRMVGPGYASGQIQKKVQEAVTMQGNGNFAAAKAEALGAIVYGAALYLILEEMEAAS